MTRGLGFRVYGFQEFYEGSGSAFCKPHSKSQGFGLFNPKP